MKVKYIEKIDGYSIIQNLALATRDTEATNTRIEPLKKPGMADADIERLIMDNLLYAKVGPEAELVDDLTGEQIQLKLDTAGDHQKLLDSMEYIDDYRGTEYWIKKSGKWEQEKITTLGIPLPEGAVLQDDLRAEQHEEIEAQKESARIAALDPDKKNEEKNNQLHIIARQANQKAEDADLLGEQFDKVEWFNSRKLEIEKKYA